MTVKELITRLNEDDIDGKWTVHPYEGENYGIRLEDEDEKVTQVKFIEI